MVTLLHRTLKSTTEYDIRVNSAQAATLQARLSSCRSVCHGRIVVKLCEIGHIGELLLITNRKSHIGLQMT